MNRNMVVAEWSRARESLRAAETLTRDGLYADVMSRTYYAMLHGAKAALHVHDVPAESHAAVRRMFGLHLVKRGEIEPEWSIYITESLDDRLAADYDVKHLFPNRRLEASAGEAGSFLIASSVTC